MVTEMICRISQTTPEDDAEFREMMEIHERDYEEHDFKADVTKYFEGFKLGELMAKIQAYREGNAYQAQDTLWHGGVQEPPDDIRPYVQGMLPIIADATVMNLVLQMENSLPPEEYGALRLALLLPVVSSATGNRKQSFDH
jgi:hypothetical protein